MAIVGNVNLESHLRTLYFWGRAFSATCATCQLIYMSIPVMISSNVALLNASRLPGRAVAIMLASIQFR
jgi:hypothetical protein